MRADRNETMQVLKLKPQERSTIMAGGRTALKRSHKPDVAAGETLVLSWTGGGRRVVDRETGETAELPRKPTVWIVFGEPRLKDDKWIVEIEVHDNREPARLLAGGVPTGIPSEPGLKTRLRPNPKPKGSEIESWSPETERGYGSGGKAIIDHLEAVDDATLEDFAQRSREGWAEHRGRERADKVADEEMRRLGNKLRRLQKEAMKYGVDLTPQLAEWVAQAKREVVKHKDAA